MISDTQVIILSSGLGTGMRPLFIDQPKVLAPVCNITILKRLLRQLTDAGFSEATITLRSTANYNVDLLSKEVPEGFILHPVILPNHVDGSVPAVKHVWDSSKGSVMVIYGDSLLSLDFNGIMGAHSQTKKESGGVATLLYHQPSDLRIPRSDGTTYHGVFAVNKNERITRFVEKPNVREITSEFNLANAVVFILERNLLEHRIFQNAFDFSRDVFEKLVFDESLPMYGHSIGTGYRLDVGTIPRFFDINMQVLNKKLTSRISGTEVRPGVWVGENTNTSVAVITPPVCLGENVTVGKDSRIGPNVVIGNSCQIHDATNIINSILMQDCIIGKQAHLENVVLGNNSLVGEGVVVPSETVVGAYSKIGLQK